MQAERTTAKRLIAALLALWLVACAPALPASTPAVPTPSPEPTATPTPTHPAPPPTLTPTAAPPTLTPSPAGPTPTPNPLADYSIEALAARAYDGGEIVKEAVTLYAGAYTQYAIAYETDGGLRVTGLMNVPEGAEPPFPVILLLHGGIDQSVYEPGDGTRAFADFFARQGYLTIAPDYRTYNNTGGSSSPLKIPWSVDVLNLMAALPTLPEADAGRVGVLGHSRGGGVASYLTVLSPEWPGLRAVVLYASLSFDQAVNWERYVEFFGAQWPLDDAAIYGSPATNPEGYALVSPIHYLDRVSVPVQIHHGDADRVVPVEWSADLYARLLELGKTVEYYEVPGAEHEFTGEDFDLLLERSLAFFERYVR